MSIQDPIEDYMFITEIICNVSRIYFSFPENFGQLTINCLIVVKKNGSVALTGVVSKPMKDRVKKRRAGFNQCDLKL